MQPRMFVEYTVNLCVGEDAIVHETPFLRILKRPEDRIDVPPSKPYYAVFVQEIDRRVHGSCVCVQEGDCVEELIKEYRPLARQPFYLRFY